MESLMQLLLEAPITPDQVNKFLLPKDNQVSIFYDKKWVSVEPVRVQEIDGQDYLIAFEVSDPQSKTPVRYELKKITNWNVLSKKSADRAKKEKQKGVIKIKPTKNKIVDSISNRRVVKFYYKGDKENKPGYRTSVKPVCYGTTNGIKYLRAWQDAGETYRGKLPKDDKEYRPMPGWRFFREDRISMSTYADTGDNFTVPPRSDFNPSGDKHITDVIAIVKFEEDKGSENPLPPAPSAPTGSSKKSNNKKGSNLQENKIISAILEAVKIL